MADASTPHARPEGATGVLVLADGTVVWGRGFGAEGAGVGEVCFNTAMTGYQEVLTDPSYAGQIVTFTFPHIGNVGANAEDVEADSPNAVGCIVREDVTAPSSFRARQPLGEWMAAHDLIGLSGVDTRALTRRIRLRGAPNAVVAHSAAGEFDLPVLHAMAADWPGLEGMDLARQVSREAAHPWEGGMWRLGEGFGGGSGGSPDPSSPPSSYPRTRGSSTGEGEAERADGSGLNPRLRGDDASSEGSTRPHVVAIDYGSKHTIFRHLVAAGARVTVVPATASFDQIMALEPAGVFLSNGPGDPAATGAYAVPVIRALLDADVPIFGICLGHQLLALAAGARTVKMHQGHRGANHPVQRLDDGVVEITSMNHGFAVDRDSLGEGVRETHRSLFDGSNAGLELADGRVFSVQHHPEASPGPQDSAHLFERFVGGLK